MSDSLPTLWQIEVSHFSEKARWALAYKGVEHERRAPLPGAHIAVALWLTRGEHKTFPILSLEGRNIGGSSAIVAALDRIEQELGPGDYLVGETFSVADLSAAALLYPIVAPAAGPSAEEDLSKGMKRFREPLKGHAGFKWVDEMFARHRKPARAAAAA